MDLSGKITIVTGASRGIGRAIALEFAKAGSEVVVAGRDTDALQGTADAIKGLGRRALLIKVDVTDSTQVNKMVEQAVDKFSKVDVLVNNAGISSMVPLIDLEEKDWDDVLNVNAKGVFLCCKAVAKQMIKQKSGRIINIASVAGKTGFPYLSHYCASKFAVIGLTKAIALELAPYKITVNAVCPGIIDTEMIVRECEWEAKLTGMLPEDVRKKYISSIALGRIGKPEDVANIVLFLASNESEYMTGQAVNISGGMETH